jgi:hypothetical protein
MLVLVYNIAKTIMVNETIEDELKHLNYKKLVVAVLKGENFTLG